VKLLPGDLLVLKWLTILNQPTSSYLILSVGDDGSFWYYNSNTQKIYQTHWKESGLDQAMMNDEIKLIGIFNGS